MKTLPIVYRFDRPRTWKRPFLVPVAAGSGRFLGRLAAATGSYRQRVPALSGRYRQRSVVAFALTLAVSSGIYRYPAVSSEIGKSGNAEKRKRGNAEIMDRGTPEQGKAEIGKLATVENCETLKR